MQINTKNKVVHIQSKKGKNVNETTCLIRPELANRLRQNTHPNIQTLDKSQVMTYKLEISFATFTPDTQDKPIVIDEALSQLLDNLELVTAISELNTPCQAKISTIDPNLYFQTTTKNNCENTDIEIVTEDTPNKANTLTETVLEKLHEANCYELDSMQHVSAIIACCECYIKLFYYETDIKTALIRPEEQHLDDDVEIILETKEFLPKYIKRSAKIYNKHNYMNTSVLTTTIIFLKKVLHATDTQINNFYAELKQPKQNSTKEMYSKIEKKAFNRIDKKGKKHYTTGKIEVKLPTFEYIVQAYLSYTYPNKNWYEILCASNTTSLIDALNEELTTYQKYTSSTSQPYNIGDTVFDTKSHEIQNIKNIDNDHIICERPNGQKTKHRKNKIGLDNEIVVIKENQKLHHIIPSNTHVTKIDAYALTHINSEKCTLLQNSMIFTANSKDTPFKENKTQALGNTSSTKSVAKTQNVMHCRNLDEAICACTNGNFLQYEAQQIWPTLED